MLQRVKDRPEGLVVSLRTLWQEMASGCDYSLAIHEKIPHFNGGLFKDTTVLPLRPDQIIYLLHAAKQDWAAVEPAIFGTLLERALDPVERHKLGAHYTPRAYVERLVVPTVVELTSPASLSTFRCCDTAGRLTGRRAASDPTDDGSRTRFSKIERRVGSANADS